MKLALQRGMIVALGLGLAACVSRGEVEQIKENQEKILSKLDEVAKGGGDKAPARPQRPKGPEASKVYAFPVGDAHIKGPDDAWVTIIESSDFQCPFCNRVNPTLKQVQDKYGDDVRIAFKHNPLPFHRQAMPAALAAECAGEQGKFWDMHDKLFANQKALSDDDLKGYAKQIGLNMARFNKCFSSGKYNDKIKSDQQMANKLGARGTPAFFINGRFLSGAQPFASFQALIDEELKKAKQSGVAKGQYYEKVVLEKGEKSL